MSFDFQLWSRASHLDDKNTFYFATYIIKHSLAKNCVRWILSGVDGKIKSKQSGDLELQWWKLVIAPQLNLWVAFTRTGQWRGRGTTDIKKSCAVLCSYVWKMVISPVCYS